MSDQVYGLAGMETDEDLDGDYEETSQQQTCCRCLGLMEKAGDWNKDIYNLYLTGCFYDCTFKICKGATESKVFRCHRLILAKSSPVFKTMLFGGFAEASKGPDDEILIDDVSPQTFEAAMRFVYGKKRDFGTFEHTLEVYKFAHKFQITYLEGIASSACIQFNLNPSLYCYLYETFDMCNEEMKANYILKMIQDNCGEVIESSTWIDVAEDTVKQILQQDHLNIHAERQLFEALIYWGKSRLDANNTNNTRALRAKIEKLLPIIRFGSMASADFSEIAAESNVLSDNEKFGIMNSLAVGNMELMPQGFSRDENSRALYDHSSDLFFEDTEEQDRMSYGSVGNGTCPPMQFILSQDAFLLAINIYSLEYFNRDKYVHVRVQLEQNGTVLSYGELEGINDKDGWVALKWPVLLKANVDYTIVAAYLTDETRVGVNLLTNVLQYQYSTYSHTLTVCNNGILGEVCGLNFGIPL